MSFTYLTAQIRLQEPLPKRSLSVLSKWCQLVMTTSSVAFQFSKLSWFLFMIMFSKFGVHSACWRGVKTLKIEKYYQHLFYYSQGVNSSRCTYLPNLVVVSLMWWRCQPLSILIWVSQKKLNWPLQSTILGRFNK